MFDLKENRARNSERGVAFILVLMLVAAVSLFAVPLVVIGSTSLLASQHADQELLERYAADSGVEYAIWRIKHELGFVADGTTETMTFNGLDTDITIAPAPPPHKLEDPPLSELSEKKTIGSLKTVSDNLVEPCLAVPCRKDFDYTLYFENSSLNGQNINVKVFGDCLPPGFVFERVLEVSGFDNSSWGGDLLDRHDLEPKDYVVGTEFPGGSLVYGPVGGEDDDDSLHLVDLAVVWNDADPDHPCLDDRWQLKWKFGTPWPEVPGRDLFAVPPEGRAKIVLRVSTDGLTPGIYYNEMWLGVSPQDVKGSFTCESSPVYARYPEWDITSSAGGSTVNAQVTIRKDIQPEEPLAVLSWQVDGEGTITSIPVGLHVAGMCGQGVPFGPRWQAEVLVTVHDENHNPKPNVTVSGTWDDDDNGVENSCKTDGSGRCRVKSGKLRFVITETMFRVDQDPPPPFLLKYNHYNDFPVTQP